jgi:PAS domain S-box-containing protein
MTDRMALASPSLASRWLRRLRSPSMLVVLLGTVALAVGVFEYRDQQRLHGDTRQLYEGLVDGLGAVADLEYETQEARRSMLYALSTTDSNLQVDYADRSRGADARVSTIVQHLAAASETDEGRRLVWRFEQAWTRYLANRDEVIASILEGEVAEAMARDRSEGGPAFEQVRAALGAVERRQHEQAARKLEAISMLSGRSLLRIVGVLCVMQLLGLLVLRMVQRGRTLTESQRSDDRLRTVLSSISEGMFVTGPDGRVESWNDAAERMTGVPRTALLGQALDATLPAFGAAVATARDRGSEAGRYASTHDIGLDGQGTGRVLELRVFPFDGGVTGFFTDVTVRMRNEQELRQARDAAEAGAKAKTEFLARMGHEIRTPMNGVLGMTNLLFDTPLTAEQLECANVVRESAEHLMHVIDDILDFSKIEAGKLCIESVAFEMADTLEQALQIVAPSATRQGLTLRADAPRVPLPPLMGDPHRLRQVLLNLLGNAVKFTERGGNVVLRLRAREVVDGRISLRLEVIDDGIGIQTEALHRLFTAFEQADGSMTRRFGGTGLGLAITRQLVELMGGRIGVESESGKGSTFWVELTLAVAVHEVAAPLEAPVVPLAAASPGGLDVLLAEDNPVNTAVALAMLKRDGHRVVHAENGVAVLENLAQRPFDVVLMDCHMPEMDGFEATTQIRARNIPVRVIALTASAMDDERAHCFAVGMDDFLSKPLTAANLREALGRITRAAA